MAFAMLPFSCAAYNQFCSCATINFKKAVNVVVTFKMVHYWLFTRNKHFIKLNFKPSISAPILYFIIRFYAPKNFLFLVDELVDFFLGHFYMVMVIGLSFSRPPYDGYRISFYLWAELNRHSTTLVKALK